MSDHSWVSEILRMEQILSSLAAGEQGSSGLCLCVQAHELYLPMQYKSAIPPDVFHLGRNFIIQWRGWIAYHRRRQFGVQITGEPIEIEGY